MLKMTFIEMCQLTLTLTLICGTIKQIGKEVSIMNLTEFYDWIIKKKRISVCFVKDVLFCCRRICSFLSISEFDANTINDLNENKSFIAQSMFVKSQLRRAVSLWNEYGGK